MRGNGVNTGVRLEDTESAARAREACSRCSVLYMSITPCLWSRAAATLTAHHSKPLHAQALRLPRLMPLLLSGSLLPSFRRYQAR